MGERPPSISPEIWQELQESKEAVKAKAAAGNGASEGSAPPKRAHPPGFRMASNGLLWTDPSDDGKPEIVVSGCFEIVAESRDDAGGNWGILLRWKDPDGRSKDWAMPRSLLAGDGLEVRRVLLDGGLYIGASAKARTLLTTYLASMHVAARLRAVTSTGWFGSTFILPDGAVGVTALDEHFILQTAHVVDHAYNIRGSLIEWQHNIARFAVGNSRLALAISAAFAACLVGPCGAESGGIHFRGRSSVGKTTALNVAGSVWGGGDRGFIRSWRATANGLEATAAAHSDGLLCLDEISQLGGREVGEIAYMLANGQGKARASREAALRKRQVWRLLFLSTGEIGLADKIAEDLRGRRQTAGQQVRVIDLPSDTGKHGLFDHLHGFKNAAVFADHLRSACALYYGTACREFIAAIAPELDETAASAKGIAQQFVDDNCPGDCDGQVKRVAARFGLIAAAGEIATALEILPWPEAEATRAVRECFAAWVDVRGGIEAAEEREGVAAVRAFLSAHALSRFLPAWESDDPAAAKIINLAGYRRRASADMDAWDFYITADAWTEVAAGFNKKALAETLAKNDFLEVPEKGAHRAKMVRVPGIAKGMRLYHVSHRIFGDADG